MPADVSFLGQAMEAAGYRYQKDLAAAAGLSSGAVSRALREGSCRVSTAAALQEACGSHRIGPYMEVPGDYAEPDADLREEVDLSPDGCRARFEGSDCDTHSGTCRSCWRTLQAEGAENLPVSRSECRLSHGWRLNGGMLHYLGG